MRSINLRRLTVAFCVCPLLLLGVEHASGSAAEPGIAAKSDSVSFVYLSQRTKNVIAVYRMSPEDGKLTPVVETPLDKPGPLTLNTSLRRLYAVGYPDTIHTYTIDSESGRIESLAKIQLPGQPEYLSLDRDGRYLLAVLYSQHQIVVCPLDKQGRPLGDQMQTLVSGRLPHSIRSDRNNRFVYVPCKGSNNIFQYTWVESGKGMSPQPVGRHATPKGVGPRHLWFHPKKDWLYVINEGDRSLTFYQIAPDKGELRPVQTLSTVSKGAPKGSGAHIQITPDGRFVYSSDRGDDSIAGFSIDQTSGELKAAGRTATARGPRAFAIDPSGRFLVSGGTADGRVVVHAIDQESGQTEAKHTYDTRGGPVWVEIVSFP